MKRSGRNELPVIQIPEPCPMQWENLSGDARKRYCDSCEKHVLNFSELTTAEIKETIKSKGQERICARIEFDDRDNLITKETRRRGIWNQLAMLLFAPLGLIMFSGCGAEDGRYLPWNWARAIEKPSNSTTGKIAPQETTGEIDIEEDWMPNLPDE